MQRIDANVAKLKKRATSNFNIDSFANRLRSRMAELQIRQTDLAKVLGVAQGSVSGWLRGRVPHRRILTELSKRIGVSEQWLLSGDEPKLLPSDGASSMAVWDGMRFMIREQERLPERIRWLREQHGLTLRQFARRLGYDPGHVSRIESGARPSRQFLETIINKLHVHRTWLEFGFGNPILKESQLNEAATRERVLAALKIFWSGRSKPDLARMLAEMLEHRHAFRVGWADAFQRILIELIERDVPAPTLEKDELFNALMVLEQAGVLSDMLKVMKKDKGL